MDIDVLQLNMEVVSENLSHLSKRGLLEIPNPPEPRYQIVQYPEGFIKVEDTKQAFGVPVSLEKVQVCKCCLSMLPFSLPLFIARRE